MRRSNGWRILSEPGIKRCADRYALCSVSFVIFIIDNFKSWNTIFSAFLNELIDTWLICFFFRRPCSMKILLDWQWELTPSSDGYWLVLVRVGIRIGAVTDPGSGSSISKNTWTESKAYYFVISKKVKYFLIINNFFLAWTVQIRVFSKKR